MQECNVAKNNNDFKYVDVLQYLHKIATLSDLVLIK